MLRPLVHRITTDELARRIEAAPRFIQGPITGVDLDRLCASYAEITGARVSRKPKRSFIASTARTVGPDFLDVVRARLAETGSETNLLADLRAGWRPTVQRRVVPAPTPDSGLDTGLPPAFSTRSDAWCGCPIGRLLRDLLYCAVHRPPFDPTSSIRYDRRSSNPNAAWFLSGRGA